MKGKTSALARFHVSTNTDKNVFYKIINSIKMGYKALILLQKDFNKTSHSKSMFVNSNKDM